MKPTPASRLVEALAYAADRVSYLQDAINTEAYIGTARSRISLRRHARLVDYQVAKARMRAHGSASTATVDVITVPAGTQFYPLVPGLPASIDPDQHTAAADCLQASPGPVFESMEDITLYHRAEPDGFLHLGRRAAAACPWAQPQPR